MYNITSTLNYGVLYSNRHIPPVYLYKLQPRFCQYFLPMNITKIQDINDIGASTLMPSAKVLSPVCVKVAK